jgi:hypothetical protein
MWLSMGSILGTNKSISAMGICFLHSHFIALGKIKQGGFFIPSIFYFIPSAELPRMKIIVREELCFDVPDYLENIWLKLSNIKEN